MEPRELRIEVGDGVILRGELRPGPAPDAPLVVLVHQLGSSRREWTPLLERLRGFSTFAFDVRGHGGSATSDVRYASFTTADWEKAAADVRTVLGHLREEEGLQPARVGAVGSSIGSSLVIIAAASDPSIDAIVAISPGRAYRGLDAITPVAALGQRPLLVIASRGEAASVEAASDMARIAPRGELLLAEGDGHGVEIFIDEPSSLDRVEGFLREHLAPRLR